MYQDIASMYFTCSVWVLCHAHNILVGVFYLDFGIPNDTSWYTAACIFYDIQDIYYPAQYVFCVKHISQRVREYFVYRDGHGLGSMPIHLAHHCFSFNMRWI